MTTTGAFPEVLLASNFTINTGCGGRVTVSDGDAVAELIFVRDGNGTGDAVSVARMIGVSVKKDGPGLMDVDVRVGVKVGFGFSHSIRGGKPSRATASGVMVDMRVINNLTPGVNLLFRLFLGFGFGGVRTLLCGSLFRTVCTTWMLA